MTIKIQTSKDGQELTIHIQGDFGFSSVEQFRQAYENVDFTPNSYVVDLKETEHLDSSALGILLALRDYAGGDQAKVQITNCNHKIKKILFITKLNELFVIN